MGNGQARQRAHSPVFQKRPTIYANMQRYLVPIMAEESKVGWTRALTSRLSLCALCTGLRYPHP